MANGTIYFNACTCYSYLLYIVKKPRKSWEAGKMKKFYIGVLCILLGVSVMAFPFAKERYEMTHQQGLLESWKKEAVKKAAVQKTEGQEFVSNENVEDGTVVGILKIPAIELEQPILEGATEENLSISICIMEEGGDIEADRGNIAIAGHHSRTYGRHFNRLGELMEGDRITIETLNKTYGFEVTGSFIVEEEDTWVLDSTLDGKEITLMTCHYPKDKKTQRLIVKGIKN